MSMSWIDVRDVAAQPLVDKGVGVDPILDEALGVQPVVGGLVHMLALIEVVDLICEVYLQFGIRRGNTIDHVPLPLESPTWFL